MSMIWGVRRGGTVQANSYILNHYLELNIYLNSSHLELSNDIYHTAMATHPTGETVDIVGINCGDNGHSCEEFPVCGDALKHDSLVHLHQSEQMMIEGVEQAVMSVFWAMDGVDCCRVGFLPKHFLCHKQAYDGRLEQITQFLVKSNSPRD